MDIKVLTRNNVRCAFVCGTGKIITDAQSALNILINAKYNFDTANIVIDKHLVSENFFILSTGLAGEILQKLINYGGRIAIYGDYSHYTSKPLKDFIYESNRGKSVFFAATLEDALDMITR